MQGTLWLKGTVCVKGSTDEGALWVKGTVCMKGTL